MWDGGGVYFRAELGSTITYDMKKIYIYIYIYIFSGS